MCVGSHIFGYKLGTFFFGKPQVWVEHQNWNFILEPKFHMGIDIWMYPKLINKG